MAERLAGGNRTIALLGNTIPTGMILLVIMTILVEMIAEAGLKARGATNEGYAVLRTWPL